MRSDFGGEGCNLWEHSGSDKLASTLAPAAACSHPDGAGGAWSCSPAINQLELRRTGRPNLNPAVGFTLWRFSKIIKSFQELRRSLEAPDPLHRLSFPHNPSLFSSSNSSSLIRSSETSHLTDVFYTQPEQSSRNQTGNPPESPPDPLIPQFPIGADSIPDKRADKSAGLRSGTVRRFPGCCSADRQSDSNVSGQS